MTHDGIDDEPEKDVQAYQMRHTLAEIAALIQGELIGDGERIVERIAPLSEADGSALTFLSSSVSVRLLKDSCAGAVIVPLAITAAPVPIIRVDSPEKALAGLLNALFPARPPSGPGIDATAVISPSAKIAKDASIGPFVVVGDETVIGAAACLGAGTIVGANCHIGPQAWLYPRVTLYNAVKVGARCILHSGVVLGSDGFGYTPGRDGAIKIPQIGCVELGDDVEIGANTTIDRATLGTTRIGKGTKIDNLVQIGHNVTVGNHVLICAQVGIAGSVIIGDGVVIAGQAGVKDHISIGSGVKIGGQAGVTKSVPPRTNVSGYPARQHDQARRIDAALSRLPTLLQRVRDLERRLEQLEQNKATD